MLDKFHSNDIGFDPLAWTQDTPANMDRDACESYKHHGCQLYQMMNSRRIELMEALFPLRTNHLLQCMPWQELELSYELHLKDKIHHAGFGRCDNYIGFVDSDVTLMIIEIGRFFTELDYSNRPEDFGTGDIRAHGPFSNGAWPLETRQKYTLHELHKRCKHKELLTDWAGNRIVRLVFAKKSCIYLTQQDSEMIYILEIIFAINRAKHTNWPLTRSISDKESHQFILDFLDYFYLDCGSTEEKLEQASEQAFAASDLNFKTLKSLGGLHIEWTDFIGDHLRLSLNTKSIKLFWDVSLLDQSLLFWYNAQNLKRSMYASSELLFSVDISFLAFTSICVSLLL